MGEDCIREVWLLLICLLRRRMRCRPSPSLSLAGLFPPLFLRRCLGMETSGGRWESCGLGRRGGLGGFAGAAWGRNRGGTATLIWSLLRDMPATQLPQLCSPCPPPCSPSPAAPPPPAAPLRSTPRLPAAATPYAQTASLRCRTAPAQQSFSSTHGLLPCLRFLLYILR
jgi:hypothetical protein